LARDVEGAKRLLQQAGVSNLSFEILAPTYLSGTFVTVSELIQANLKDIGIATTIKPADTATSTTAQQSGNYQATVQAGAGRDAVNVWLPSHFGTGGGQNYAKYSDPEMDKLIAQQAVLVKDPEARQRTLQEIQRKIIADAVFIPLLHYDGPVASLPELKDFYPPAGLAFHTALWTTVWIDK